MARAKPFKYAGCLLLILVGIFWVPLWCLAASIGRLCVRIFKALPVAARHRIRRMFRGPKRHAMAPPWGQGSPVPPPDAWDGGTKRPAPEDRQAEHWRANKYAWWAKAAGCRRILLIRPGISYEADTLCRLGFDVTTIEPSQALADRIAAARAKDWWLRLQLKKWVADRSGLHPEASMVLAPDAEGNGSYVSLVGDFREHDGRYDIIAFAWLSWYTETPEMVASVAAKLTAMLEPGGLIVADFPVDPGGRRVYTVAFRELGIEPITSSAFDQPAPADRKRWLWTPLN